VISRGILPQARRRNAAVPRHASCSRARSDLLRAVLLVEPCLGATGVLFRFFRADWESTSPRNSNLELLGRPLRGKGGEAKTFGFPFDSRLSNHQENSHFQGDYSAFAHTGYTSPRSKLLRASLPVEPAVARAALKHVAQQEFDSNENTKENTPTCAGVFSLVIPRGIEPLLPG
jgi:hypothetical protein